MTEPTKFAFILAMQREVKPLLKECKLLVPEELPSTRKHTGRSPRLPEFYRWMSNSIFVCSGPGYKNAISATRQTIEMFSPETVISTGFVGALSPELKIGDIFVPRHVISERTGSAFTAARGKGTLITAETVVGEQRKHFLYKRFKAQAVDMETAAVAAVAADRDCEFLALKVISDELNSRVDFVEPFVKPEGLRIGAFLAHVSLRPWLWPAVFCLQRDSSRAAQNLCRALRVFISEGRAALEGFQGSGHWLKAELKGS